ncbi:MAG: hypothetical protein ACFFA8_02120 [Promethearchaeota archaeon]
MSLLILFQIVEDWPRILPIFVTQPFISVMFIILAYKVLKRKVDRISLSLGAFYIILGIGFVLNIVYLVFTLISNEPLLLYILYYLTIYPIMFSTVFIVLFINILLRYEAELPLKPYILYVLVYGVCSALIIIFPGGITLNPENSWAPEYTWEFLIFIYLFFTISITVPIIFYSNRLYKHFQARNLKGRLRLIIIAVIELLILFYGVVLFNTWPQYLQYLNEILVPIFKTIWGLFSAILVISSALLLYYSLGRNL